MEQLPMRWCIQWKCKKNYEVINNYFRSIGKGSWVYTQENIHSEKYVSDTNQYDVHPSKEMPEITFEEFKRLVLNQNSEIEYSIF